MSVLQQHLVIFVKAPRIGTVKTRLAKGLGKVGAWCFYHRQVSGLLKRLSGPWQIHLFVAPDDYVSKGRFWPGQMSRWPQGKGDLGARMQKAFDQLPTGPVVIIGSDIPGIQRSHIQQAFQALRTNNIVMGPAYDGGYWLIGQRRQPVTYRLFNEVRWSSEHTLQDTLKNVPASQQVVMLEKLQDVDTLDDLRLVINGDA